MESAATSIAALNESLIYQLKKTGALTTEAVEQAFRFVPRHLFVPGVPLEQVYKDEVIITRELDGQPSSSCSQPAIVAIMLEQLGLERGQHVLEIGAGTGHTAALIASIVGEEGSVTTLDIEPDLVVSAREHLASAAMDRVHVVCADGWAGYPEAAPYDRVLLTVASWDIAPAWQAQLKPDGRMVLPLDIIARKQKAVAFENKGDYLESVSVRECGFLPLRGESAPWPPAQGGELGPEPGLGIEWDGPRHSDLDEIYRWLTGPHRDWQTGLKTTTGEVWGGLGFWLALRSPDNCSVGAQGPMVDLEIVPRLFVFSNPRHRSRTTQGLLGERGLALLTFSQAPTPVDSDVEDRPPADLVVCSCGPDEAPAHELIEQAQAWDAARRPSGQGLRIRVYPGDAGYAPVEGESIVIKKWTRLVLDWPNQA